MSDTRNQELTDAVNKALEGTGLEITCSDAEITITDPRQPGEDIFVIDFVERYLAWERQECDFWHFGEMDDDQAAVFIAGKLRGILGEKVSLSAEMQAQVELARREELSARVMSGELDDVSLHVRRG